MMKLNNTMTSFIYVLVVLSFLVSSSFSASIVNPSPPSNFYSLKGFSVVDFGAKNDGVTDATQAFLNTWNAACASPIPSEIYVPSGDYLLKLITFEGPCQSSILFRIDGTLVAQNPYYDDVIWITFHNVDGLHIKGGVINAKGRYLWYCKALHHGCPCGATSLSFDNSKNIIVDGLTSIDSQKFHIKINACQNVNMGGMTITADGDSPNTDGIHIEQSKGITIMHSQISTGDDCISIGPNNQNIWIEDIFCGPGHGISIGSLGRDSDEGVVVQNVTVKSATFKGTQNGLRIKTFSTSIDGAVKDIYFLGATMTSVENPIIIDQNYCPHDDCPKDKGSGIQISNVIYTGIHGSSSTKEVMVFDCSPKKPCYGLTLQDINLSYKLDAPKCECDNCNVNVAGSIKPSECLAQLV